MCTPALYRPAAPEIAAAVEAATALAPALWSRLVCAGGLLRDGCLVFGREGWTCGPQTCHGFRQEPCHVTFGGCDCAEFCAGDALVGEEVFCRHRLALLMYCDICLDQARRRLLGTTTDAIARAEARSLPNCALLVMRFDRRRKQALVAYRGEQWALPALVCQVAPETVRGAEEALGFASEQELAAFARWLAQARACTF
jgi:hypothetical protein